MKNMMIMVTGGTGLLGQELSNILEKNNYNFCSFGSRELDITKSEDVLSYVKKIKPNVIFHCAAYTITEKAEDECREQNYLVNELGTKNIVEAAKEIGATLVYISTDYVFDGSSAKEYEEDSIANPLNEYGKSKLLGENIVKNNMDNYYIIRTSWVFGKYGHNFVYTMRNLAKKLDVLNIVNDQIGRPTWAKTLADFMLYVIKNKVEYGIYHLSNDGSCSWYDFAKEILKEEKIEIVPISSKEFPQKARRPKYSALSLEKTKKTGFVIPSWQEALKKFLQEI